MYEQGWVRGVVCLQFCTENSTGYCNCPLSVLRRLLFTDSTAVYVIPFSYSHNKDGDRMYTSPWHTTVYEQYTNSIRGGSVTLIDFYSDGAKM